MRTSKVKPKKKFIYKPTFIEASFLRKGQIDKHIIRKEYKSCIHNDEYYQLLKGGCGWHYCYNTNSNTMFTSRNSHKQTNKKK